MAKLVKKNIFSRLFGFQETSSDTTLNICINLSLFLEVLIISNAVLKYFGFSQAYIIAFISGYAYLITKVDFKKWTGLHFLKLTYFLSVLLTCLLHLSFYHQASPWVSVLGFCSYVLAPFFWFLTSLCINDSELFLKELFWKLRYFILTASVIGIIQYFYSPTLFGVFSGDLSQKFLWASELSYHEYTSFFRTTSLWASPQICGLYLGLFIIGYYTFMGHRFSTLSMMFPYFVCGLYTFNKSFMLNMLLLIS